MKLRIIAVVVAGAALVAGLWHHALAVASRPRRAAEELWARAQHEAGGRRQGRDVILALFVSRQAADHARAIADVVEARSSSFVWPVVVSHRDTFADRLRRWAPHATVVVDPSFHLLEGLAPVRGYPAMAVVRRDGRTLFARGTLFGASRIAKLLSSTDSVSLARAMTSPLALPETLRLASERGTEMPVALPHRGGAGRPQLWTYSAAGCGQCEPMLRMIDATLGSRRIDWYHVAYRGDFHDGRWPLPGRAPRAILTDPRGAAADAFDIRVTPGLVLIDGAGAIRVRAVGRDAYHALGEALSRDRRQTETRERPA